MEVLPKYKKIAFALALPMLILCLTNTCLLLIYDLGTHYYSTLFNIVFSFLLFFVFLLSFTAKYSISRFLQVLGVISLSLYVSIVNKNPLDTSSMILLGYSVLLIWLYYRNELKPLKKLIFVCVVIFLSLIIVRFVSANVIASLFSGVNFSGYSSNISNIYIRFVFNLVPALMFLFLFSSILWLAVVDELLLYLNKSKKLQTALYKSESDAWYGRNVVGVVHNIKNKLTPVYLLLEEFSMDDRLDKETRDFCKTQIKSVDGLSGLLDKLMYSTKVKNKDDIDTININKTVVSIIEFFKSNLEFKRNITLTLKETGEDISFKCNPMNFCFVIENVIKNSYDNLKCLEKQKKINIEIVNKNNKKWISIKDNGTGIDFIKGDEFSGSLLSCGFFKIGNSTKKDGLGYGMEFIKTFLIDNNIDADIYTKRGFGTEIKIFFKN